MFDLFVTLREIRPRLCDSIFELPGAKFHPRSLNAEGIRIFRLCAMMGYGMVLVFARHLFAGQ